MKSSFSKLKFSSCISNVFVHKSKILLKAYLAVELFVQGEKCYQFYIFIMPPVN